MNWLYILQDLGIGGKEYSKIYITVSDCKKIVSRAFLTTLSDYAIEQLWSGGANIYEKTVPKELKRDIEFFELCVEYDLFSIENLKKRILVDGDNDFVQGLGSRVIDLELGEYLVENGYRGLREKGLETMSEVIDRFRASL